jgi:CheY-like chemotaxis protein
VSDRSPQRDLAGVLHDVSNALTVLLGWIGEARAEGARPEDVAYALRIVEQRARVARDLARQAIGASRIETPAATDEITREVVETLRVEAAHAAVALVADDRSEGQVMGALDLMQVLTNLVLNAIAFAPRDTNVEVAVSSSETEIVWTVTDHGAGVPEDKRDAIFDGESLRPGGVGVGLRHARALARAWGGDVVLLPKVDGSGARFLVSWPRADLVPRPPVSAPRLPQLAGMRVLVLEDDLAVTQLVETALEARGAEVVVARAVSELNAALEAPFDAALIDLSPIEADVPGALRSIRQASPGIALVLITGSADRIGDWSEAEGMQLVRKPFEVSELLTALKNRT